MHTNYDLDKIKFATDKKTFKRAVGLYEAGKVTAVETMGGHYAGVVEGTQPYRVSISARSYKQGICNCYLGERGTLCKHVIALALYAVMDGKPLKDNYKTIDYQAKFKGQQGELKKENLAVVKKSISAAMRYIKPYSGPSRTWFANQDSLCEGCNRLSAIVFELPVSRQTAELLVKLLLRLDKKLRIGGVDDSNGTVGGFMNEVVGMLIESARINPECVKAFDLLVGIETCFDWKAPLVRIVDEGY